MPRSNQKQRLPNWEFILVKVSQKFSLIFPHMTIQLTQYHFLKNPKFPNWFKMLFSCHTKQGKGDLLYIRKTRSTLFGAVGWIFGNSFSDLLQQCLPFQFTLLKQNKANKKIFKCGIEKRGFYFPDWNPVWHHTSLQRGGCFRHGQLHQPLLSM